MRSVSPNIDGADDFIIAEDQLEYKPVVAALVRYADGVVVRVLRYTLTHDERARVAAGEDLYFGTPASQLLQPHWITVGFPR